MQLSPPHDGHSGLGVTPTRSDHHGRTRLSESMNVDVLDCGPVDDIEAEFSLKKGAAANGADDGPPIKSNSGISAFSSTSNLLRVMCANSTDGNRVVCASSMEGDGKSWASQSATSRVAMPGAATTTNGGPSDDVEEQIAMELREAERALSKRHQFVMSLLARRNDNNPAKGRQHDDFMGRLGSGSCRVASPVPRPVSPRLRPSNQGPCPSSSYCSTLAASAVFYRGPGNMPGQTAFESDGLSSQTSELWSRPKKVKPPAGNPATMHIMPGLVRDAPNPIKSPQLDKIVAIPSMDSHADGFGDGIASLANGFGQFELIPCWKGNVKSSFTKAAKAGMVGRTRSVSGRVGSYFSRKSGTHPNLSNPSQEPLVQRVVIHPCSTRRGVWDVISLCLVAYDVAVLPLQFFELDSTGFMKVMTWFTRIFWTCDLPISFFTGYLLHDGFIVLNLFQIVRHYLKTWFLLDLTLVGCDWAELGFSVGKAGDAVRTLRMIRLLRTARMREIIKIFTFRTTSEKYTILADIAGIIVFIISGAHLMACFWYAICNVNGKSPDSWISQHSLEANSVEYRYLMSLHWSLSQLQGGMDEMRAHNLSERIFNVVTFLIAFMAASVCISGLTSSMTRLDLLASHQSRQLSVLRRYLIQNGISDKLAMRVQWNALHAISEQERLMAESKVELLAVISDPLRVELHFEMYSPVLEAHNFFSQYIQECPHVMHHICHRAMKTLLVSYGDVVFDFGEIPEFPQMYVVCHGGFQYVQSTGEVKTVNPADFISEAVLWIHWMHRGMLHATKDGRLCVMDARHFQSIVNQFEHPTFDPKSYAVEYVRQLNMCQACGIPITDLSMEMDTHVGTEESVGTVTMNPKPAVIKTMLTNILARTSLLGSIRSTTSQDSSALERGSQTGSPKDRRVSRSVLFGDKAQAKAEELGKQRASIFSGRGGFR